MCSLSFSWAIDYYACIIVCFPRKNFCMWCGLLSWLLSDLYACICKACLCLRNVRNEECEIVCAMGCVFVEWRPKNIMFLYNNEGVETKLIKKCHRYVPLIHISNLVIFHRDNLSFFFFDIIGSITFSLQAPLESYPNRMISAYRIIVAS